MSLMGTEKSSRTKITVLRGFDTAEVFKEPPIKARYSGPCPLHKVGQIFSVDDVRPDGFCPYAWDALFPTLMTLRFGGDFSEWYDDAGTAVISCPDGLRPVIFKLERETPKTESPSH